MGKIVGAEIVAIRSKEIKPNSSISQLCVHARDSVHNRSRH